MMSLSAGTQNRPSNKESVLPNLSLLINMCLLLPRQVLLLVLTLTP